jgi:hypothetical protein
MLSVPLVHVSRRLVGDVILRAVRDAHEGIGGSGEASRDSGQVGGRPSKMCIVLRVSRCPGGHLPTKEVTMMSTFEELAQSNPISDSRPTSSHTLIGRHHTSPGWTSSRIPSRSQAASDADDRASSTHSSIRATTR